MNKLREVVDKHGLSYDSGISLNQYFWILDPPFFYMSDVCLYILRFFIAYQKWVLV